jgi:hypothetical protein
MKRAREDTAVIEHDAIKRMRVAAVPPPLCALARAAYASTLRSPEARHLTLQPQCWAPDMQAKIALLEESAAPTVLGVDDDVRPAWFAIWDGGTRAVGISTAESVHVRFYIVALERALKETTVPSGLFMPPSPRRMDAWICFETGWTAFKCVVDYDETRADRQVTLSGRFFKPTELRLRDWLHFQSRARAYNVHVRFSLRHLETFCSLYDY